MPPFDAIIGTIMCNYERKLTGQAPLKFYLRSTTCRLKYNLSQQQPPTSSGRNIGKMSPFDAIITLAQMCAKTNETAPLKFY